MCVVKFQQVLTSEDDLTVGDLAGRIRYESHDRENTDALTTSTLTHDAQRFTVFQRVGDAVYRVNDSVQRVEPGREVSNFQKWGHGCFLLSFNQRPWIKRIAQAIADEIYRKHSQYDQASGEDP